METLCNTCDTSASVPALSVQSIVPCTGLPLIQYRCEYIGTGHPQQLNNNILFVYHKYNKAASKYMDYSGTPIQCFRLARLLHVPALICNPLLCEVQQSWLWSVATQECANTTFQSAVRVRAWLLHLFLPCKYEYCYSFPFWNAWQYDMHKSKFHWLKHNVKCYFHSLMMIIDALQCALYWIES